MLTADEADPWREEIIKADVYLRLINHRHLSSPLTIDQLQSLRSILAYDGPFVAEWMKCEIIDEHLNNPAVQYPNLNLFPSRLLGTSISDQLLDLCEANSVKMVTVLMYHITLRAKMSSLPLLSIGSHAKQGLHLCDTKVCILKDHLIVESHEVNASRRNCFGIMIQIHQSSSGTGCITKLKPCVHGRKLERNLDEQLKYSSRKIQVIIADDNHVVFYK